MWENTLSIRKSKIQEKKKEKKGRNKDLDHAIDQEKNKFKNFILFIFYTSLWRWILALQWPQVKVFRLKNEVFFWESGVVTSVSQPFPHFVHPLHPLSLVCHICCMVHNHIFMYLDLVFQIVGLGSSWVGGVGTAAFFKEDRQQ